MADGAEALEEERRLLYVAMTRARDALHVVHPLRFFVRDQRRYGDRHLYAARSRFITDKMLAHFERVSHGARPVADRGSAGGPRLDMGARLRSAWRTESG
jgi:DNA helicase-2/ATP-dependent DNA helicase PcrA